MAVPRSGCRNCIRTSRGTRSLTTGYVADACACRVKVTPSLSGDDRGRISATVIDIAGWARQGVSMTLWRRRSRPRAVEGIQWQRLNGSHRDAIAALARRSDIADGAGGADTTAGLL